MLCRARRIKKLLRKTVINKKALAVKGHCLLRSFSFSSLSGSLLCDVHVRTHTGCKAPSYMAHRLFLLHKYSKSCICGVGICFVAVAKQKECPLKYLPNYLHFTRSMNSGLQPPKKGYYLLLSQQVTLCPIRMFCVPTICPIREGTRNKLWSPSEL